MSWLKQFIYKRIVPTKSLSSSHSKMQRRVNYYKKKAEKYYALNIERKELIKKYVEFTHMLLAEKRTTKKEMSKYFKKRREK